jgi:S-adenosylmethionine hydrolase
LPDNKLKLKLAKTYAETKSQEPISLIGSHGFLEIALNQDSAAEKFKLKIGDKVKVTLY